MPFRKKPCGKGSGHVNPDDEIRMLRLHNDTQAETIKRLWVEITRLKRRVDGLQGALERASKRKPTPEEVAAIIFGDGDGQGIQ